MDTLKRMTKDANSYKELEIKDKPLKETNLLLKAIAFSLGISYNSLVNDLERVNYLSVNGWKH